MWHDVTSGQFCARAARAEGHRRRQDVLAAVAEVADDARDAAEVVGVDRVDRRLRCVGSVRHHAPRKIGAFHSSSLKEAPISRNASYTAVKTWSDLVARRDEGVGVGDRPVLRAADLHAVDGQGVPVVDGDVRLGFGRIVASEKEAPLLQARLAGSG